MALKQFDKWREQDSKGAGIWTTAAYKKAWKAALEWVLSNYPDDAIYEIVKKELGNDN